MVGDEDSGADRPQGGIKLTAGFGMAGQAVPQETRGLPAYRILVVGAFGGAGGARRHRIQRAEIAHLPATLGVALDIAVPNRLGDRPATLGDRLTFEDLRDFSPKRVAERFAPLREARRVADGSAEDDGQFSGLAEALRRPAATPFAPPAETAAKPASPDAGGDGSLDRLLGMVETVDETASDGSAAQRAVSAFIAGMGSRSEPVLAAGGSPADVLVVEQRDALFRDAGLCDLMETWQGLKLFASALDPEAGIEVDLLDIGDRDVADALADVEAEETRAAGAPLALIVVSARFSIADAERMRRIARAAEVLQAPALASFASEIAPGLDLGAAAARDEPGLMFDGPGFETWNTLRDEEAGRWLTVCWNDALARNADADGPALWVAPAWVVATQIARSIAACGWPSEIGGRQAALGGFDVHEVAGTGRRMACAAAALLSPNACRSLGDAGVLALSGTPDRDEVLSVVAPAVHRPGRFPDDPHGRFARLLSSLPYQLAAGRLAVVVGAGRDAFAGQSPEHLAAQLETWLAGILAVTGPEAGAKVTVEPHPDDAARQILAIEARTGSGVLGGEHFAFDIAL